MWIENSRGSRWLIESPSSPDAPTAAGISFRTGYLDETAGNIGVTTMVAQLAVSQVMQPREQLITSTGEEFPTNDVKVEYTVDELFSHFVVIGDDTEVARALDTLCEFFNDPVLDDLVPARERVEMRSGAPLGHLRNQFVPRWGAHGPALGTIARVTLESIDKRAISKFMAHRYGSRNAVIWTTSQMVPAWVEVALNDGDYVAPTPLPSSRIETLPATIIRTGHEHVELSAVVDNTLASHAANLIFVKRVRDRIELMEPIAFDTRAGLYNVDANSALFYLRTNPGHKKSSVVANAIVETLEDMADSGVGSGELESASAQLAARWTEPGVISNLIKIAENSLINDERDDTVLMRQLTLETPRSDVNRAVRQIRTNALLTVGDIEVPYPVHALQTLSAPSGKRYTNLVVPAEGLRTDGATLSEVRRKRDRFWKPARDQVTNWVDLHRLAYVVNLDADRTYLVDDDMRMVGITWQSFAKNEKLRAIVSEAAKKAPQVVAHREEIDKEELRRSIWKTKRSQYFYRMCLIAPSLLAIAAVYFILVIDEEPAKIEPIQSTLGQKVTYPDGMSVQAFSVSKATPEEVAKLGNVTFQNVAFADVEVCGATQASKLEGKPPFGAISSNSWQFVATGESLATAESLNNRQPVLPNKTLGKGECVRGWVAASHPSTNDFVKFRFKDIVDSTKRVTWKPAKL